MKRMGIVMMVLVGGCGQDRAAPADRGETPATAETPATTETAAQPADPSASHAELVPAFPGSTPAEIPNFGVGGTDSRSGNSKAMETGATVGEVAAFYRRRFAADNMPVRVDTVTTDGGLMSIGRDGERGAMLTITGKPSGTRITVTQKK